MLRVLSLVLGIFVLLVDCLVIVLFYDLVLVFTCLLVILWVGCFFVELLIVSLDAVVCGLFIVLGGLHVMVVLCEY